MAKLRTSEFVASFNSYVYQGGEDSRIATLNGFCGLEITELVQMVEPYDFAALTTVGVTVQGNFVVISSGPMSSFLRFVRGHEDVSVKKFWKKVYEYLMWAWHQPLKDRYFSRPDGSRSLSRSSSASTSKPTVQQMALVREANKAEILAALRTGAPTSLALRSPDVFDILVGDIADPAEAREFMESNLTPMRRAELMAGRFDLGSAALEVCSHEDLLLTLCRVLQGCYGGLEIWDALSVFLFHRKERSDLGEFLTESQIGDVPLLGIVVHYSRYSAVDMEFYYILGDHATLLDQEGDVEELYPDFDIFSSLQETIVRLTQDSSKSSGEETVLEEIEI